MAAAPPSAARRTFSHNLAQSRTSPSAARRTFSHNLAQSRTISHLAFRGQEDILGFDVGVAEPLSVQQRDRPPQLRQQPRGARLRPWAVRTNLIEQVAAVDELHHNVKLTLVGVFVHVHELGDARVQAHLLQHRHFRTHGRGRLTRRRDHLDGDLLSGPPALSRTHDGKRALAEQVQHLIIVINASPLLWRGVRLARPRRSRQRAARCDSSGGGSGGGHRRGPNSAEAWCTRRERKGVRRAPPPDRRQVPMQGGWPKRRARGAAKDQHVEPANTDRGLIGDERAQGKREHGGVNVHSEQFTVSSAN